MSKKLGVLGGVIALSMFVVTPVVAQENLAAAESPDEGPALEENVEPAPKRPLVQLEWSKNPGVFEEDLRRRDQNSLYFESRREIGKAELRAAKKLDAKRMWQDLEDFIDLMLDKRRMSRLETASEMGDALLTLDEGTWRALQVGGESYALAQAIQELRSWLLLEWRVSSERDPGVAALLAAEGRIPTVETGSRAIRFMALIQGATARPTDGEASATGPILIDELGTALMSEDRDTIVQVLESSRGELRSQLRLQLVSLLEWIRSQAMRPGVEIRDEDESKGLADKFAAVGVALGMEEDFTLSIPLSRPMNIQEGDGPAAFDSGFPDRFAPRGDVGPRVSELPRRSN